MLEHGAYRLLLDRYYGTEQGIPSDQAHRVARARTKEEKQAVDAVLDEFFHLVGGVWINNRAEEEIEKAHVKISTAQTNGKKGGRPKKAVPGSENETQEKPSGLSPGSENETQEKAHQAPSTKHQTPVTTNTVNVDLNTVPRIDDESAGYSPADLTISMRKAGVDAQPADPRIIALATQGVTPATMAAACAEAKLSKPNERIKPGYVIAIVERWAKEASGIQANGARPNGNGGLNDKRKQTIDELTGRSCANGDDDRTIDGEVSVIG